MNIYKCGQSVIDTLNDTPIKEQTYVCVLPCTKDFTIETGVTEMIRLLKEQGIDTKIKKGNPLTVISKDKAQYTLANYMYKDVLRPATIFRHVQSQMFTYESLYYDKTDQLIYRNINDVDDAHSNRLRICNHKLNFYKSPILLNIVLEKLIIKKMRASDDLSSSLYEIEREALFDKKRMATFINRYSEQYISFSKNYNQLHAAIFKKDGLTFKAFV